MNAGLRGNLLPVRRICRDTCQKPVMHMYAACRVCRSEFEAKLLLQAAAGRQKSPGSFWA